MPSPMKNRLLLSLRFFLGAVFAVSGFQKLIGPYQNFAAVIEKFEILNSSGASWMARTMPWAELVLGVFLVLGLWERLSLAGLWAMNTSFIAAIASALARKLPIQSCGCFGEAVSVPLPVTLAFDILLWALFLLYFLKGRRPDPHAGH